MCEWETDQSESKFKILPKHNDDRGSSGSTTTKPLLIPTLKPLQIPDDNSHKNIQLHKDQAVMGRILEEI